MTRRIDQHVVERASARFCDKILPNSRKLLYRWAEEMSHDAVDEPAGLKIAALTISLKDRHRPHHGESPLQGALISFSDQC